MVSNDQVCFLFLLFLKSIRWIDRHFNKKERKREMESNLYSPRKIHTITNKKLVNGLLCYRCFDCGFLQKT
jgi:predicted KAP-like P-loop ATPase